MNQKSKPPLTIRCNEAGFPFLCESSAILELILSYLALPYSVSEYGCGKRASMILAYLFDLGIAPYALSRGLALEADMSPSALEETDWEKRPHAMVVSNPLCEKANLNEPFLRQVLQDNCPNIRIKGDAIHIDEYVLRHRPKVQFALARSHVYPVLKLYDEKNSCIVERIIDPTLDSTRLFPLSDMRKYLDAEECLLFEAPLLGHFILDADALTRKQKEKALAILRPRHVENCDDIDRPLLEGLSIEKHARLVRHLTRAEPGSIGDPETWTYANNIASDDGEHQNRQRANTGIGYPFRSLVQDLAHAYERKNDSETIRKFLEQLQSPIEKTGVRQILINDAKWSIRKLEPLANITVTISYYNSLLQIKEAFSKGKELNSWVQNDRSQDMLRGLAIRIRRRIDRLADVSRNEAGKIDARPFQPGLQAAIIETIKQMNQAGLEVYIDRAGNIHGISKQTSETDRSPKKETTLQSLARNSIWAGSSIDTIFDASAFAGRLGIASGIEIACLLYDLNRYFSVETGPILVTAFIEDLANVYRQKDQPLSGSAAVSGIMHTDSIYARKNATGQTFAEGLEELLQNLQDSQREGIIELAHDLTNIDSDFTSNCFDPLVFFSPYFYERQTPEDPSAEVSNEKPLLLVEQIISKAGPISLEDTGCVLMIERNFRDTQNRYMQTIDDITKGTFLHLMTTLAFLTANKDSRNLYAMCETKLPVEWNQNQSFSTDNLAFSAASIAQKLYFSYLDARDRADLD